jgi:hypothetical protein
MKQLAGLCLVFAALLGALEHLDRSSALALTVVEWSQRLGVPLFVLAIIGGLGFMVIARLQGGPSPPRRAPAPKTRPAPPASRPPLRQASTLPPIDPIDPEKTVSVRDPDWRDKVRALANDLQLGKGARITMDLNNKAPFILHLEHLSPVHCKRAVTRTAGLISVIPVPPRLQVVFSHCPQIGVPRHHQVAGALSQVLPRSQFRVVSHVDTVDVLFLHPDPAWST